MYKAVDVAKFFVNKGIEDQNPVTQMKLQKLVFFAHGLYYAYTEGKEKLIEEPIEAWKFGPVIPVLYEKYKYFGADPITPENDVLNFIGKSLDTSETTFDRKAKELLEETWEQLKYKSAIELSNWTHQENSAWHKVYRSYDTAIQLRDEDILEDFKQFIQQ